jgi:thymidylate synthase (FAD)
VDAAQQAYERLLDQGVCREQARAVLPQGVQSEVIWTASLHALLHFLELRTAPTAQYEIRQYAEQVSRIVFELWPITLTAWRQQRGTGFCTPHNCLHG